MKTIIFMILVTGSFFAVGQDKPGTLAVNEFETKLSSTGVKTVLDVRTREEYDQGHMADAQQIDFYKSDFRQQLEKLDKNKPVFVYCAAGGRSSSASGMLAEMGFKQVYDLKGGLNAWKKAGKPIIIK